MTTEAEMRHAVASGFFSEVPVLVPGAMMLLLHIHSSPAPYGGLGNEAFIDKCLQRLLDLGLIQPRMVNTERKVTERGRMFVEMILATPLPEQRWVDPRAG